MSGGDFRSPPTEKGARAIGCFSFRVKELKMIDFKTYDEQIEILRNRGMRILDSEKNAAIQLLKRNNYYNIINGYKDLFVEKGVNPEKYLPNVSFKEVYDLHQFDKEVRLDLSHILIIIERTFASIVAYEFSKLHPNHDIEYMDINNYNTSLTKIDRLTQQPVIQASELICNFNKEFYDAIEKGDRMICHYKYQYGKVPLWVFINKLTFGTLSKMFKCLNNQERTAITQSINQTSNMRLFPNDIQKALSVLVSLRNKCAHDQRVYDFDPSPTSVKPNDSLDKFISNENYNHQSLFGAISCLSLFVSQPIFSEFVKKFKNHIIKLFSTIHSIPTQRILDKMGVPQSFLL